MVCSHSARRTVDTSVAFYPCSQKTESARTPSLRLAKTLWRRIMRDEPKTYRLRDICRIFDISETTAFRRLKESRESEDGILTIPLPLNLGHKRGLRWDADQVRAFIQSQAIRPPPQSPPPSPKQARHQFDKSVAALKQRGVKIGNVNDGNK